MKGTGIDLIGRGQGVWRWSGQGKRLEILARGPRLTGKALSMDAKQVNGSRRNLNWDGPVTVKEIAPGVTNLATRKA